MPFATNEGVRVHYAVEGSGPPLVLQHWSLGSLEGWYAYGYVDALKQSHRVIALDARGHGRSDKPRDPKAYALEHRVSDIVSVLDALRVERAHYYGYSMGGWIGYGIAKIAPERFRAVAVGGAHPYAQDMSGLRKLLTAGVSEGPRAFVETMRGVDPDFARVHEAQWMAADFGAQLLAAQDRTSLEDAVPTITLPWLVLCGTDDSVFADAERACGRISRARFEPMPGLDHGGVLRRSDLVVPLLRTFFDMAERGEQ
jgi:pimeloyl-ACP methyl ester carboxylesterase